MKKINIQSILLIGFSFIALIVLSSGIRELIILNKLNNLRSIELKINHIKNILDDNKILIRSEKSILNMIKNADQSADLEFLKYEHEHFKLLINKNFNLLYQYLDLKEHEMYLNDFFELRDLIKKTETLFNDDFLVEYIQIFTLKSKLVNFDVLFVEQLDASKPVSKEKLYNRLDNDLFDLYTQINISIELISNKYSVSDQKITRMSSSVEEKINKRYIKAENTAFIFILIIIALLSIILIISIKMIIKPISKLQVQLDYLTQGELPENIETSGGIEIRKIGQALNKLVTGLKSGVEFSLEIGKGNFEATHKPLSENDVLGNSLLTLRENLKLAQAEDIKRKNEDAQRNRTNEGLTMFSDILRQHTENISELADEIISSLVKFTNANQGGLFFLNEEDEENIHYELIGAYAYNRKKYISKNIKPGEGLVGAVAIEKYTIYMTEVPDEYIEIESGVGSANPRSIIIVPLQIEDQVLGVIELASFNTFESYEVEMVEKIADSIAASLANARINIQTASLLEHSKDQEKLMVEQEKELEQSIEEIKTLTNKVYELQSNLEKFKKKEIE